ncbi:UNVERIFIED_CONTAM: NCS1 family nucleobase:cation symporter-1 [Brevibacillus sp. OAP136]
MKVERHFIEFVPEDERHGNVRSLFSMWFAPNVALITMITGGLGVQTGLNLFWSAVAIVLGNLIGGILMALHSVQGPRLGIPQMIQSRAQFGVMGAVFPILLVILMYVGYCTTNVVIGAQAFASVASIPFGWGVVIVAAVTFFVAVIGYDLIHGVQKALSVISGLVFLYVTIAVFQLDYPQNSWSPAQFNSTSFLLLFSVSATWQLTYGPYIADYSRYLPKDTDSRKTFFYTLGGTFLGAVWCMILGAILTDAVPRFLENPSLGVASLGGSTWSLVLNFSAILSVMFGNVINLYGAFMSITTVLETFIKIKSTLQTRFTLIFITTLIVITLAVLGHNSFVEHFETLMLLLSYTLFPWTTINLVDFFFLRHGTYNLSALFDPKGEYGTYNWKALIPYLITIVCEVPFMSTALYEGPIARALNGADLAWIVAITLPGILYYYLMKKNSHGDFDKHTTIS